MRWMNLETIKQSKSEREKQILYINAYIWNLEGWYWWTCLQSTNGDADTRNKLVDTAGEGQGKMNWESSTETNFSEVKVKLLSRVQLCDPMDCSPPGSSMHGIFQARMLEQVAISFSSGPSWPRDRNPGLLHCRQTLYHLSHQGTPNNSLNSKETWGKTPSHWNPK